jgi:hypothetical protein
MNEAEHEERTHRALHPKDAADRAPTPVGALVVGLHVESPLPAEPPRSAEILLSVQYAQASGLALAHEGGISAADGATDTEDDDGPWPTATPPGDPLPREVRARLMAEARTQCEQLVRAGASPAALRKRLVEMANAEHREEVAAFESVLWRRARAEAWAEAGERATPRAIDERTERLLDGLRNTSAVSRHRHALEQRGKALDLAWRLAAQDQTFSEARGRARRMYRHNVRRADGLVEALRLTAHYWVEMNDGRRVAVLRHRRDVGYRFEPATRLERRLSAALRERFGSERFYDPDTDAIAVSKFVYEFEAAARVAKARAAQSDYAHQARTSQSLEGAGNLIEAESVAQRPLAFPAWDDDSTELRRDPADGAGLVGSCHSVSTR